MLANLSGCCHFTFGLQATNLALWSLFGKDSCAQQQPLHEAAVRLLLLPPSWPKPRQFQIGLTNPADRKGVYKPSLPLFWLFTDIWWQIVAVCKALGVSVVLLHENVFPHDRANISQISDALGIGEPIEINATYTSWHRRVCLVWTNMELAPVWAS